LIDLADIGTPTDEEHVGICDARPVDAKLSRVKGRHLARALVDLSHAVDGILVLVAFLVVLVAEGDVNATLLTRQRARRNPGLGDGVALITAIGGDDLVETLLREHLA